MNRSSHENEPSVVARDKFIEIKGAAEHNLKHIDVKIPKDSLVVITGVSGSGKSSLAFDTIYAEGQRRYVESLSSYARQFIGQLEKPKYETIRGLSPTIAIEQKSGSKNPRSTVGTITEIYDFLRVLYARMGVQHCFICDKKVGRGDPESIVSQIAHDFAGQSIFLLAPLVDERKGEHREVLAKIKADGYSKVRINGIISDISDVQALAKNKKHSIEAMIDRLQIKSDQTFISRLTGSVETAIAAGQGKLIVAASDKKDRPFSTERSCCGQAYKKLEPQHFSFNSPLGMCEGCQGLGNILDVDEDKIVNRKLSIAEGALAPWESFFIGGQLKENSWGAARIRAMEKKWDLDIHTPFEKLPLKIRTMILSGTGMKDKTLLFKWRGQKGQGSWEVEEEGIKSRIMRRYQQTNSEAAKTKYMRYMSYLPCSQCQGSRLRADIRAVRLYKKSIDELCHANINEAYEFFDKVELKGNAYKIGYELIKEIKSRLFFLKNVGLGYLSLDRKGPTLSGGEAQRIRLASQIGSELTGVLYVLDEPSIGLHQKDNRSLLATLAHLKKIGNTVLVVEHDRETIEFADWVIDMGPRAGELGGEIIAEGTPASILANPKSLTGSYLKSPDLLPKSTRLIEPGSKKASLWVRKAQENNLKGFDLEIPLNRLVCFTGVSGAGKSTLVHQVIYPYLANRIQGSDLTIGKVKEITGFEGIEKIVNITQQPIGKTPRSNPATYTKVFDLIRDFFAILPEAKLRGYSKGRFSFNVSGGRCDACLGDGFLKVEMHFLADVFVPCEVCKGKRFNQETLMVKYKNHSIADVLAMSVVSARELFQNHAAITKILDTLIEVGLDYVRLGQAATTLSGGEAQRIKLAKELAKREKGKSLYFLDEPTTGLHFDDIKKLMSVLNTLVDRGNSIILIEHNTDVIKACDWLIDLGPEGGEAGGHIIAQGTPEMVKAAKKGYTCQYL